jgi:prephenate dehydrogenase
VFKRLCIIGLGLIGGSIARAARRQGLAEQIVAYAQENFQANLQTALQLGVIDAFYTDISAALQNADCVIIATPVGAVQGVFMELAPFWRNDVVYSDACSTKGSVVAAAQAVFGAAPANFIPAHPIAGAERSGVEASSPDLFFERRLIITPLEHSDPRVLEKVRLFWQRIGACVSEMTVEHHDTVLAATSHLPHILAFTLVGLLGRKDEQREIFKYAAGGFKDFSRIASSDPTMWLDICLANKYEILPLIQQFQAELSTIAQQLEHNQAAPLYASFTYARNARQRYLDQLED